MAITKVKEMMRVAGPVLNDRDTIAMARARLGGGRVQQLPVVDREGRFVGLVTHLQLVSTLLTVAFANSNDLSMEPPSVGDMADRKVPIIGPDATAAHAAHLFVAHRLGCLPVVDRGKLVGVLTEASFLHFEQRYVEQRMSAQGEGASDRPAVG